MNISNISAAERDHLPGPRASAAFFRAGAGGTFGRGDLAVCPLGGCTEAQECLISDWRVVPQGSPQGQALRTPPQRHFCASLFFVCSKAPNVPLP